MEDISEFVTVPRWHSALGAPGFRARSRLRSVSSACQGTVSWLVCSPGDSQDGREERTEGFLTRVAVSLRVVVPDHHSQTVTSEPAQSRNGGKGRQAWDLLGIFLSCLGGIGREQ